MRDQDASAPIGFRDDASSGALRRTLVVANRTAGTADLLAAVERRADERPTAFTLLIPDAADRKAADWTLAEALTALRRAAAGATGHRRARVEGRVAGPEPFPAIEQALREQDFHEVLISTLPARRSVWLRRDLPQRVRALGVPVTVITPPEPRKMGIKDLPMAPGPG